MSLDELRSNLRGPEGVQSRIAELQSRWGAQAKPIDESFAKTLGRKSALPGGTPPALSGQITASGTTPMNPFAGVATPSVNETQLRALADSVARREGVDPKLLSAIVEAESGWDPMSRSDAGAQGLTQLMPDTAKEMGVGSTLDPEQSLVGGARYIKKMLGRFNGDVRLAVAAYNAGPTAVERASGVPNYAETQTYVKRVMARYGRS